MIAVALAAALTFAEPATPPQAAPAQQPRARSGYVQGTLNIAAGERVVLRPTANGGFEMVEARIVGLEAALPPAEGARPDMETLFAAEPGTLAVSLGAQAGTGSFLKIENRLSGAFAYIGLIVVYAGGQTHGPTRTTVCTVPQGRLGWEHWQEPILQVVMGHLRVVQDGPTTCETEDSIRAPASPQPPTT